MDRKYRKGIPKEQFQRAQKHEKDYWKQRQNEITTDEYRRIKRKAAMEILSELKATTNDSCLERVLEIGGGGDPMIEYFKGDIGVVIDPIGRFYKTELFASQLAQVQYFCGYGENLPFKKNSFDGVLLYNCIDHGFNPFKILDESKRVLRYGGALHLLVDTYSLQFAVYRKILENITHENKYMEHPNCLRFKIVSGYLEDIGFVELKNLHGNNPCSRILKDSSRDIEGFLKGMVKGRRALRAFYRLEEQST